MEPLRVQISNILGFEHLQNYAFSRYKEDPPLFLLESEDESINFLLVDPFYFFEYSMTLPDEVQTELQIASPEDALVLSIVKVDREKGLLTTNLLGPIVINLKTRQGTQLILNEENLSTKHPLPIKLTLPCSP